MRKTLISQDNLDVVEAVAQVAESIGKTSSQVALGWVASQPAVTSPIFGARTLEQLEDNLGAADLVLDEEANKRLEEASSLPLVYPYDFHERVRAMTGAMNLER